MKVRFTKLCRILILSFLVSVMLLHVFGRQKANAAGDVPPRPVPIVVFDLYTQKGGTGPGIPGGEFTSGENVVLYVNMTSNGLSVENRIIAFEIEGPANSYLLTAVTNSSGMASVALMISLDPAQDKVLGTWCATAQTGLDIDTVGDTLNFEVTPIMQAPEIPALTVLIPALILTTTAAIILRRKTR